MMLHVQSGATLTTFAGVNIEQFGTIRLEGGAVDAQYVEILGGTLEGVGSIRTGSGPIAGQVENRNGRVSPGLPGANVGTLNISGRFANGNDGVLWMHLGFTSSGVVTDRILVDGPVNLDGTLDVGMLANGAPIAPQLGQSFSLIAGSVIAGEFSTLLLPALTSDKMWQLTYDATEVLLKVTIPGDFDGDFTVDGDDLAVWREDFGGVYSGVDFLTWQRNLGMSIAPIAAVPEPSGLALGAIALVGFALRRRSGPPKAD
jgi:hypothetical protein